MLWYTFGIAGREVSGGRYKSARGAKNAASRAYGSQHELQVGYISNISNMFIPTATREPGKMKWETL